MTPEERFEAAAEQARRATCDKAHCGCVIVSNDQIIGRGYNSPPLNDEVNRRCDRDGCCLHAEWRAIMDALRHHPDSIIGSALYFTRVNAAGEILRSGEPYCTVCSRLALDVGIATFGLWHVDGIKEYPTDEYNRISLRS